MKGRNKDSGGTTSSEDVSPSPLVQIVIYVIYVAAQQQHQNSKQCPHPNEVAVVVGKLFSKMHVNSGFLIIIHLLVK